MPTNIHVIQVIGHRDSGKTTLICRLIRQLTLEGFRVGTVKHDAHRFEIDHEGKDTWKHRMAGAETIAITSQEQTAVMRQRHTPLGELLYDMRDLDLILVEGFKAAPHPKIVLIRTTDDLVLLEQADHILAVMSWIPLREAVAPIFDINDFSRLYAHLRQHIGRWKEGLV